MSKKIYQTCNSSFILRPLLVFLQLQQIWTSLLYKNQNNLFFLKSIDYPNLSASCKKQKIKDANSFQKLAVYKSLFFWPGWPLGHYFSDQSLLVTIFSMVTKSHYLQRFLVKDPQIFLKAPWAPIYTNIEGGARAEKTQYFSKFFKKCLKKFQPVYSKLCLKILAKTGTF